MQHYFFDVLAEGRRYPDCEGVELPDLRKAHAHALGIMVRVMTETAAAWDWRSWSVEVVDPKGRRTLTVVFPTPSVPPEVGASGDLQTIRRRAAGPD